MVHVDSGGAGPPYGCGQCEEGDGEDVAAAGVTHSHEESCRWQQTCREEPDVWRKKEGNTSTVRENITGFIGSLCVLQHLFVTPSKTQNT